MRLNYVKCLVTLFVFIHVQICASTNIVAEIYVLEEPLLEEVSYESLSQQYESVSQEIKILDDLSFQCSYALYRIGMIEGRLGVWEGRLSKISNFEGDIFSQLTIDQTLSSLKDFLNGRYCGRDGDVLFDGKLFSGMQGHRESPLSVNLDLVPLDFDVYKPISTFYIGHLDPTVISIGNLYLTLDILSTDEEFENVLRALMIMKTGRKNECLELIDQLLTNAKTKFEVTKQKASDYLKQISNYQKELKLQIRQLNADRRVCMDALTNL